MALVHEAAEQRQLVFVGGQREARLPHACGDEGLHASRLAAASAYVSIRQHTSAYVSARQHTSEYVSLR
jgi:hypothetical protein